MRDLNLNEFSAILRATLKAQGVDLSKSLVYQMTKAFFVHAEKTAAAGDKRFIIHRRSLTQIYPVWNVKKLCAELAVGDNVVTIDQLIREGKAQKKVLRYYKKMNTVKEVEI
jgi:predicted transcriptional regulator